jgi:tetratricopeptide (TPR) repeat protein
MIFSLAGVTASSQSNKSGPLLKRLAAHQQKDTARLSLLIKAAAEYAPTDQLLALKYADSAIRLAVMLKQPQQLGAAYLAKALTCAYKADLKNAIRADSLAINAYKSQNDKPGMAKSYIRLSLDHCGFGNYATSLNYARIAFDLARQCGDERLLLSSYTPLGISYTWLADYTRALDCYLRQLKLAVKLHDTLYIAKVNGNIGVVYFYLKKYPEALKYYTECLAALEKLNDQGWVGAALNNIGAIYIETGDYRKVVEYNKRALAINLKFKIIKGEANDLTDISLAYTHLHRYDEAFTALKRAIAIYKQIGARNNSSIALGQMASLYAAAPAVVLIRQGIPPRQRFARAMQLQQQAVKMANETGNINNESDQWKKLSLVFEKMGNYKDALESYRAYSVLKDSIFNDKKRQEITRLNLQYDYDKKEAGLKQKNIQQQARASSEIARQKVIKNASIIVGLVLLVFGGISVVFYERRKDAKEKIRLAELKTHIAETELKALRSQLNPHFIFNSLNSIGDYIARHDKVTADIYLAKFAKLMRRILENSENKMISLADDLQTLELYMQLEALRLDNKFLYEILVDDDIDTKITMVPPMLLQPFVENSIWHGISPKQGSGKIIIRVRRWEEMIEYVVEDNGIGREQASKLKLHKKGPSRKSFGIRVTQSRINIINQDKSGNAKVELTDLDEGTRVSIRLPYEPNF